MDPQNIAWLELSNSRESQIPQNRPTEPCGVKSARSKPDVVMETWQQMNTVALKPPRVVRLLTNYVRIGLITENVGHPARDRPSLEFGEILLLSEDVINHRSFFRLGRSSEVQ